MPVTAPKGDRIVRKVKVYTERPLKFEITPQHEKVAKCKDPCQCVIAQALTEALGPMMQMAIVGATVVKIITDTKVIMYRTPQLLKIALQHFDKKLGWPLDPGNYKLLPYSEKRHRMHIMSTRRWQSKKRTGGLRTMKQLSELTRIVPHAPHYK
jgi:hypothetical protein